MEEVRDVRVTVTLAYARWLLRDFSDESEDISLDEGSSPPPPPRSDRIFITQFP